MGRREAYKLQNILQLQNTTLKYLWRFDSNMTHTTVSRYNLNLEQAWSVVNTMTGDVRVYRDNEGRISTNYLAFEPKTNIEDLTIHLYTQDADGSTGAPDFGEFMKLVNFLKRSRRWKAKVMD